MCSLGGERFTWNSAWQLMSWTQKQDCLGPNPSSTTYYFSDLGANYPRFLCLSVLIYK